jgi:signal peptidase I
MHRFVVHEDSMQPALLPGDRLVARRRQPREGDVVVFREPGGERHFVKRVVAVGGSTVRIEGRTLTVESPDGSRALDIAHAEGARTWTLLDDEVFVLSDDPTVTRADSRVFGPVEADEMYVAVFRYSPLRRMGIRL